MYDFEDYSNPNKDTWFKVKNIETRVGAPREYAVEHILEWQMLVKFLTGEVGKTNKQNEMEKPAKAKKGKGGEDEDEIVNEGEGEESKEEPGNEGGDEESKKNVVPGLCEIL